MRVCVENSGELSAITQEPAPDSRGSGLSIREVLEFMDGREASCRLVSLVAGDYGLESARPLALEQMLMRGSPLPGTDYSPSGAQRPVRNFLWVRRPLPRRGRLPGQKITHTMSEVKAVPALVLFASFVGIAILIALFIH